MRDEHKPYRKMYGRSLKKSSPNKLVTGEKNPDETEAKLYRQEWTEYRYITNCIEKRGVLTDY